MPIELYPNIAKVKRNGVFQNLPGFVQASGDTDIKAMIASSETSTTAQYAHPKNSFFILNDVLYQADENIAVNGTIAVGTNCHVEILGDVVSEIENDFSIFKEATDNAIFNGKLLYNTWYQGSRATGSSINTISANTKRCTTNVFRLEKGNSYKISGIPTGYKVVLAGNYDEGDTYDSGWITSTTSGYIAAKSGYYFLNAATSSGSGTLTPADISSIYIEIEGERFYFSPNDRVNELSEKVNSLHKLVNYGYGYRFAPNAISGKFNVSQNDTLFTITGSNTHYSYFLLSKAGINSAQSSGVPSSFFATTFEAGHTYKITLKQLNSGTYPTDYLPTVSVYESGSGNSSIGTYEYDGNDTFYRIFTASADKLYAVCFYTAANETYENAQYSIIMEDITENVSNAFVAEVNTTIEAIRTLQTEPSIVFPLVTDIHYGVSENGDNYLFKHKTINNIKAVLNNIRADMTICLGDVTDGDWTKPTTKRLASEANNLLRNLGIPYLLAIGNHDDNRYGTTFSEDDMYAYYCAFVDNNAVFNANTKGRDYYIDLPNYKVRFVVLDSNGIGSYGYPQDCVDWFEDVALDTPDNYLVIVLTHISPISSQNYNNYAVTNGTAIATAIEAYQTNGKPIIQLYGHSHCDVSYTSPYLSIGTNCAKFENTNGDPTKWPTGATKPERVQGEVSEDCWDVVVLRPLSRKIDFVRFGAGSDRTS